MYFGVWFKYIRRQASNYRFFPRAMVLVILLYIAGCSPSTHQNTTNSSKTVSPFIPSASALSTENKIESSSKDNETRDSSSI